MFHSLRVALIAIGFAILSLQAHAGDDKGFVDLFNGKDLAGFKIFPEKITKTFTVEDGYIKVSGNPAGYFFTDKSFKNCVIRFDWRYVKPGGNSGLLLHIQGKHKVWPNCLEVQGANNSHGSFISIGKTGLTNGKFNNAALTKSRKKVGEWNTTEVTVKNGDVTVKVNGTQVNSGKMTLVEGPFGFQSEGAEIHFKNIKVKTLE